MKRILIAALLAVGIHGLMLGMEYSGLKRLSLEKPRHRSISVTLAIRQPQIPPKKVEDIPPVVPHTQPLDIPKPPKKKRTTKAPKPEPQKNKKPSAQPIEKPLPDVVPQIAAEPLDGVESAKMEPVPQEAVREPALQTIIEARPMYRVNPPPKYPAMARRRGYAGHVVLDVLVGQNGNVADLRLFSSSGYDILDKAAISSVKNWTFEPGMRGDETVEMWVRVPVRFELK